MTSDPVTLTLPFLTLQDVYLILSLLSFPIAATVLWFIPKDAKTEFRGIFAIFGTVWLWILMQTLLGLWQVFNGGVTNAPLAGGSLGLGALIAAFLGAPFVIYGTYLRHKTNRLEQEGHMTDRINKAVEQLGAEKTVKGHLTNSKGKKVFEKDADGNPDFSRPTIVEETMPNIEVRMGAILSLERIAQDSTTNDKGRDHVRVMEILCAYIRENSNARKPVDFPLGEWVPLKDDATEEERETHLVWSKVRFDFHNLLALEWAKNLSSPRSDVALALKVIGRRSSEQRLVEAAWPNPPDSNTRWPFDDGNLKSFDISEGQVLKEENLEAFLRELSVWTKKLDDYRGYRLDLSNANLQRADMSSVRSDRSDAIFSGAKLTGARLEGARLIHARLEGCTLAYAKMAGSVLLDVRLDGASLMETWLEAATLVSASLDGASIVTTRFEGAWMFGTSIRGAVIRNASWEGALTLGMKTDGVERSQRVEAQDTGTTA
ncbi:MAG: pentapeptide repeat-containing protein [Natronohydrobacter sp.]|nr:pentapeptide repeat-containing protein [Natronohydrobacter sp.]